MKKGAKVLFNASVILAGLKSPRGGSGKLLSWAKNGKIKGYASEIVVDEVLKHAGKIGLSKTQVVNKVCRIFPDSITPALEKLSAKYVRISKDSGDTHLFESAKNEKVDYLVSLDKKHVLAVKDRVKDFGIVSPGELILRLSSK